MHFGHYNPTNIMRTIVTNQEDTREEETHNMYTRMEDTTWINHTTSLLNYQVITLAISLPPPFFIKSEHA